ncbi:MULTISPECIES: helix-turn-helix domain-containing protein [unclassified Streptomyces]|uniref:helix-turn-helix domain-containing protein n=1 Tax=unclassified Streptomyces TaxID=2593676 RepID=UPI0033CAF0EC
MAEIARTSGASSRIERGELAEVAELGNVLKKLFTTLDINQSQYARRIHIDKSTVSRYLSGTRLPTKEFVQRLVSEVEEDRGVPLQREAKEAIHGQWLAALQVCDPAEHTLETLRAELARSKRNAERAHRNVEALHRLLEQKESEAHAAADDLTRLRLDWSAERTAASREQLQLRQECDSLSSSREALLREIEQLKEDLREAERQRAEAEVHRHELRDRVLRLEEELAEREPTGTAGTAARIPLDVFQAQLLRMWKEEEFPEAARDLTEAAWVRPLDEVAALVDWLAIHGDEEKINAFVADVGRLRSIEDVIQFCRRLMLWRGDGSRGILDSLVAAIASRTTERNVVRVYRELRRVGFGNRGYVIGDRVLSALVRRANEPLAVVALLRKVGAEECSPHEVRATAYAVASGSRHSNALFPLLVVIGLINEGMPKLARAGLSELCPRGVYPVMSGQRAARFHALVEGLDEGSRDVLFGFVAGADSGHIAGRIAEALFQHREGEGKLLDRLLDELRDRDALELLFPEISVGRPVASPELRTYVTNRYR